MRPFTAAAPSYNLLRFLRQLIYPGGPSPNLHSKLARNRRYHFSYLSTGTLDSVSRRYYGHSRSKGWQSKYPSSLIQHHCYNDTRRQLPFAYSTNQQTPTGSSPYSTSSNIEFLETVSSDVKYALHARLKPNNDTRLSGELPRVPKGSYVEKRALKRAQAAAEGKSSDTRWIRSVIGLVCDNDLDGAERMWHSARLGRRDLEDLRRASKEIMKGYNKCGRWLDTIRFFKWNEDAVLLEQTVGRGPMDVLKREDVGIYLLSLDERGRIQEIERQKRAELGCRLRTEIKSAMKLLNTSPESRISSQDSDCLLNEDVEDYIEELRDTILRLGRLPQRYIERPVTTEQYEAALQDWVAGDTPEKFAASGIDGELLDICFRALLGRLDFERVLMLFYQYQPHVRFTCHTLEYVIAAYINLGGLKKAQGLLRFAIFRKIPLTYKCYVLILHAVKSMNGSWDKQVRYFKWLEKLSKAAIPELYHIMVQTAIERGMTAEAEQYLKMMQEKGHQHTAKTCGDILSSQAKVENWEGLQKTLEIIDEQGFSIPIGSFNAVLNSFANKGNLSETEEFFRSGIERGIIPDVRTYNIMIKAVVYHKGVADPTAIEKWMKKMVEDGIQPDPYTFNLALQDLRQNYRASASIVRRVYQRILRAHTSVVLRNDVSKDLLLKTTHLETKAFRQTYRQIRVDGLESLRNQDTLALRMASAIEAGNAGEALALWKEGLKLGKPSFQVIVHALRACVISSNNKDFTAGILAIAKQQGMIIPATILSIIKYSTRRLRSKSQEFNDLDEIFDGTGIGTTKLDKAYRRVEEAYQFLERNNLRITHHLTVFTANYLINSGEYIAAINLMRQVATSRWGRNNPFDIVGICVILKAYCRAGDMNGVQWVVDWMIKAREKPTKAIYSLLDRLQESVKHKEKEREFMRIVLWKLHAHDKVLAEGAKQRARFLIDFIHRTVGISTHRKHGVNWPFITRQSPFASGEMCKPVLTMAYRER